MPKKDVADLKGLLQIGKIFGFYHPNCSKTFNTNLFLYEILYGTLVTWSMSSMCYQGVLLYGTGVSLLLAMINIISSSVLICLSFVKLKVHRKRWEICFRKLADFDEDEHIKVNVNQTRFYLKQIFMHFIFLFVSLFWAYEFIRDFPPYNVFTLPHILCLNYIVAHYKATWIALVMNQLTHVICARYASLEKTVDELMSNHRTFGLYKKIRMVQYKTNLLFECVQHVNSIFGASLVTVTIFTLIKGFHVFVNIVFRSHRDLQHILHSLSTTFQCAQIIIYVTLIVQGCDNVEKKYERILVKCNKIQSKVSDGVLREEFIILCNYMKKLSPKFTAAGFFQINKHFFSKFLSILVTYLIIIVQFKQGGLR